MIPIVCFSKDQPYDKQNPEATSLRGALKGDMANPVTLEYPNNHQEIVKKMNSIIKYKNIEAKILLIRDQKVLIDKDVADIYGVET